MKYVARFRVSQLRRRSIEGRFLSTPYTSIHGRSLLLQQQLEFIHYSRIPKLSSISGNIVSAMSFSSIHQDSHETSSAVPVATQHQGIVERTIREKLLASLSPVVHLTILNESNRHNV